MDGNNQITQWEYKKVDTSNEKELNQLGEQGWEVTGTFSSDTNSDRVLLKRPKIKQTQSDYNYSR